MKSLILAATFLIGCSSSEVTKKASEHTEVTVIDTVVFVTPEPIVWEGQSTLEESEVWQEFVTIPTDTTGPAIQVKRNKVTGSTRVNIKNLPKVAVEVKATKTVTDKVSDTHTVKESFLDEFKDLIIWGTVGVVVLAGVFVFIKKRFL